MENNISDLINKFNTILKDKNIDLSGFNQNNNTSPQNPDFNFDISTILKFKNIFDKANNTNNSRTQLLYSLKPFLREQKQEKLEQIVKISNILYILNFLNENGDKK